MNAALLILLVTLAGTSVMGRPQSFESEEYTDNNLSDSLPLDEDLEDERTDYVQM